MIKIKSEILPIYDDNQISKILNKEDTVEIKISIIDTGIGIKQNELKSLLEFKDNNMLKSAKNYNQEGSGLGLSITKNISDFLLFLLYFCSNKICLFFIAVFIKLYRIF